MRRTLAIVPLLALAALAEEGTIPFELGAQGFKDGEVRFRLEPLHKGAVDGAAGTTDGTWLAWVAGETLFTLGGTGVGQTPVAARSRLLGCTVDGKALLLEPGDPASSVCAYDLAGGGRSVLFQGEDASRCTGARLAELLGARAIVGRSADGSPVLLSPNAEPVPLDPVLSGATGLALSPDRPFVVASTAFDLGFVCLSSPGLRPVPLEGYTPIAWPSRSAILLTRPDGLYLLTLLEEAPPVDADAARRAEEERKRREEAERARREEEERKRLADAERAKQEEARRLAEEAERAKQEETRRLAEEERKRQEEAERAKREAEQDIVDFVGVGKARLGDAPDAVQAALAEPDQREEGEEEGQTDWIYAARGLVLTFDDEAKQLVRVQAKAKPDQLPVALKDRFRPFRGKTEKGTSLGASRAEIEAAYGAPAKVFVTGAAEMLTYDAEAGRMSFHVERGKLVLIMVQRKK